MKFRRFRSPLLVICLWATVTFSGKAAADCGDTPAEVPTPGTAERLEPAASPLPAGDDAAGTAVRFTLINQTRKPIYLQEGEFWGLVRGGEPLRPEHACEYCNCATPSCAVCGRVVPRVVTVDPGAQHSWRWSGLDFKLTPGPDDGTVPCERPEPVPAGTLTVHVTYSLSKIQSEREPGTIIGPPVPLNHPFEYPRSRTVVLVVH